MALTGGIRATPGDPPAPDKSEGCIFQESAGQICDSIWVVDADLAALPDDIDALRAALTIERARMRDVVA